MIYGGINYFYFTGGGEGKKRGIKMERNGLIIGGGIIKISWFGIIFRIYYWIVYRIYTRRYNVVRL